MLALLFTFLLANDKEFSLSNDTLGPRISLSLVSRLLTALVPSKSSRLSEGPFCVRPRACSERLTAVRVPISRCYRDRKVKE